MAEKSSVKTNLLKGIIKENPIFVFLLGMCSALAMTKTFETALGMGVLVLIVLIGSNVVVSLIKKLIPDEVRIPCYIVIIALFVTVVKILCQAFAFTLYESLGVFLSLITVNCMILGRAEAYASKNNVFDSFIDAVGMGLGYIVAMVIIGIFRELLGTGAIVFGANLPIFEYTLRIFPAKYAFGFLVQSAGGFISFGVLLVLMPLVGKLFKGNPEKKAKKQEAKAESLKEGEV